MKMNFVINSIGNSGGDKVVRKYAKMFSDKKNDVTIYVPIVPYRWENNIKARYKQLRGIASRIYHYILKKETKKYDGIKYKAVFRIENKFVSDADVVIATAWPTAYDVAKLNDNKGKKFYFVQDYEIWDDEEKGKRTYTLPLNKIVISTWIKDKLIEQGINDDISMLYNGIDANLYRNDNKKFENNEINCLMLGHKLRKKGVKEGLDSFHRAKKNIPNLRLKMFGLRKQDVDSLDINDVEFIENPDKKTLIDLYKNSDIFIFPSLEEGWGLTVVEAMCAKCAVVGTNTGCLVDIGKNGKNALICEPGNVEEMKENIIKLAKNRKLREDISNNGFETVKNFDWEKQAERFIEILNEE